MTDFTVVTGSLEAELARLQSQVNDLIRQRDALLRALMDVEHTSRSMRIWAGMEWKYHPYHAKTINDTARAAIDAAMKDAQNEND